MFIYGTRTFVTALFAVAPNLEITQIPMNTIMNK